MDTGWKGTTWTGTSLYNIRSTPKIVDSIFVLSSLTNMPQPTSTHTFLIPHTLLEPKRHWKRLQNASRHVRVETLCQKRGVSESRLCPILLDVAVTTSTIGELQSGHPRRCSRVWMFHRQRFNWRQRRRQVWLGRVSTLTRNIC